ncbi:MAG: DUF1326 domain-containing protein [Dehalococcoidia bacterium]|nr:DUF1326 domain-containing protein [Dehalococcoidia bacterium]MDP7083317.1 DUF1326 domain-containing protein [Dehalococcoidia bacterium]
MAEKKTYLLKGTLLGACNCGWGCPCNFEEPPTPGYCEGNYVWHVEHGHYAGTALDGSTFAIYNRFPGAVHEGNATTVVMIDDQVPLKQRTTVEALIQEVPPFSVFMDLTSDFRGFRYLPINLRLDGIRSRVTIPGVLELQFGPMKNPVTGEDELATLNKPTGFTSNVQELCSADTHRFNVEGMTFDYSGKYGEFSPFVYSPA